MNGAEHDGLLTIFLAEAEELLELLHEQLAELRYGVDGQRLLNDLHRSFDTIQSGAAVMKLSPLSELAGCCERVIERLRRRRLPMTPRVFSLLDAAARELENMVQALTVGNTIKSDTQSLQQQLLESIEEGRSRVPETSVEGSVGDPLEQFFESPAAPPESTALQTSPQGPASSHSTSQPLRSSDPTLVVSQSEPVAQPLSLGATTADAGEDWRPLKVASSGTIKPLPALSRSTLSNSPPPRWRQLSRAAIQAHRDRDSDALRAALEDLAEWLDRH